MCLFFLPSEGRICARLPQRGRGPEWTILSYPILSSSSYYFLCCVCVVVFGLWLFLLSGCFWLRVALWLFLICGCFWFVVVAGVVVLCGCFWFVVVSVSFSKIRSLTLARWNPLFRRASRGVAAINRLNFTGVSPMFFCCLCGVCACMSSFDFPVCWCSQGRPV